MKLTSQILSLTCLTPTFWPANTVVPTKNLIALEIIDAQRSAGNLPSRCSTCCSHSSLYSAPASKEAFPWSSSPYFLLRDRDRIYGKTFRQRVAEMGTKEVLIAPRSPWQSPYVERLIGSIRRECLNHFIVFNESGLRRILRSYFDYYQCSRTHLALAKDAPEPRTTQPPGSGKVVALPILSGLHHRYERRAA